MSQSLEIPDDEGKQTPKWEHRNTCPGVTYSLGFYRRQQTIAGVVRKTFSNASRLPPSVKTISFPVSDLLDMLTMTFVVFTPTEVSIHEISHFRFHHRFFSCEMTIEKGLLLRSFRLFFLTICMGNPIICMRLVYALAVRHNLNCKCHTFSTPKRDGLTRTCVDEFIREFDEIFHVCLGFGSCQLNLFLCTKECDQGFPLDYQQP